MANWFPCFFVQNRFAAVTWQLAGGECLFAFVLTFKSVSNEKTQSSRGLIWRFLLCFGYSEFLDL